MSLHLGLEIAFTDSDTHHWVRKRNGDLMEISQSSIEYYCMQPPIRWKYPDTESLDDAQGGESHS
jgi:hypothetical protein